MRALALIATAGILVAACSGSESDCVITGVAIVGAPASIAVGAVVQLSASVDGVNCPSPTLSWGSSNSAILAVDQDGKITGVAAGGPVTITARAGKQSVTVQISVSPPPSGAVLPVP